MDPSDAVQLKSDTVSEKISTAIPSSMTDSSPSSIPVNGSSTDLAPPVQLITSRVDPKASNEYQNDPESSEKGEKPKGSPKHILSFNVDKNAQRTQIRLKRAAYTYGELEQTYLQISDDRTVEPCCQKPSVEDVLPPVYYARMYKCKKYPFLDLFAGLTVASVHLPQGLALGLLANLTPISGVYTSIFSSLLYVIFGTVPYISMGPNALLALMTGCTVEREAESIFSQGGRLPGYNASSPKPKMSSRAATSAEYPLGDNEERMNIKMCLAVLLSFQCGLILLLMGLFRLGFLTNYMPFSFVGGFGVAACLHIIMSQERFTFFLLTPRQMKHVFHIKVPVRVGLGRLIYNMIDISNELENAKTADVLTFIVSAFLLVVLDHVINPVVKAKVKVVVPSNLILTFIACMVSYSLDLHAKFDIAVVGTVSSVPPTPPLKQLWYVRQRSETFNDSLLQAVMVFSISFSMAMLMEKLHDFELDFNRELIAYGMCNLGSSFVSLQTSCTSPYRTNVLSNCGTKTTFHGIPTAVVLLCTLILLADTFRPLPLATLAAIIIVNTSYFVKEFHVVPQIWRVSRVDFWVWIVTYLSTALGDIAYGVPIGILIATLGFMVKNQFIKGELVVRSTKEDLLLPGLGRAWTKHVNKTRIFYFPSQLFFANAESFKRQLYEQVFDPSCKGVSRASQDSTLRDFKNIHFIILDCSAMTYIDIDGLNMLKTVVIRYHNAGVQMMLARCPHTTMKTLERGDFFKILPRSMVFHEVIDALVRETSNSTGSRESMTFIAPNIRRVSTASLSSGCSTSIF